MTNAKIKSIVDMPLTRFAVRCGAKVLKEHGFLYRSFALECEGWLKFYSTVGNSLEGGFLDVISAVESVTAPVLPHASLFGWVSRGMAVFSVSVSTRSRKYHVVVPVKTNSEGKYLGVASSNAWIVSRTTSGKRRELCPRSESKAALRLLKGDEKARWLVQKCRVKRPVKAQPKTLD